MKGAHVLANKVFHQKKGSPLETTIMFTNRNTSDRCRVQETLLVHLNTTQQFKGLPASFSKVNYYINEYINKKVSNDVVTLTWKLLRENELWVNTDMNACHIYLQVLSNVCQRNIFTTRFFGRTELYLFFSRIGTLTVTRESLWNATLLLLSVVTNCHLPLECGLGSTMDLIWATGDVDRTNDIPDFLYKTEVQGTAGTWEHVHEVIGVHP